MENKKGQKEKKPRCRAVGIVSEIDYDILKKKLKGNESAEDKTSHRFKNVCRKINKFGLTLQDKHNPVYGKTREEIIDLNNKIVVCEKEVQAIFRGFYDELRGGGVKKLKSILDEYYSGISRDRIQELVDNEPEAQRQKPQFRNVPELKTITASQPMERHQIDLVDLSGIAVEHEGETYRYVLSILDVFSRFLWLRPLPDKTSMAVATEMKTLYMDYCWGCPRIIQTDQGGEFKGHVSRLCLNMGTKMIRSRPSHPQSQGKCERSHKEWKAQLEFDMRKREGEELNWVEYLPAYARIHNEARHSSLNCSPYKAMFGVKPNHFSNILMAGNEVDAFSCSEVEETEEDLAVQDSDEETDKRDYSNIEERLKTLNEFQKTIKESSKTASEVMKRGRRKKVGGVSSYEKGDLVLVRKQPKGKRLRRGKKLGEEKVRKGEVLEKKGGKYQVKFLDGTSSWIPVEDITSRTLGEEKKRKKIIEEDQFSDDFLPDLDVCPGIAPKAKPTSTKEKIPPKSKRKTTSQPEMQPDSKRGKFNMSEVGMKNTSTKTRSKTYTMADLRQLVEAFGMEPIDNIGAGNCMFIALAEQLELHDVLNITQSDLRKTLVDYIKKHHSDFSKFLIRKEYSSIKVYCNKMGRNGHWGDQLILQAAANRFNVTVRVLSTANERPILIAPTYARFLRKMRNPTILDVGHLSELHYVTLIPMLEEKKADRQVPADSISEEEMKNSPEKPDEKTDGKQGKKAEALKTDTSDTDSANTVEYDYYEEDEEDKFVEEDYKFDINPRTWEQLKEEVVEHIGKISRREVPAEQQERHNTFVEKYPYHEVKMYFAEGYLSVKMFWKLNQFLLNDLTLVRSKNQRQVYSGKVRRFTFKVERKLDDLTNKDMSTAAAYIEYVLLKEAIIFMIRKLHPSLDYETVNKYCTETEVDAKDVQGRGFIHEVDAE